IRRGPRGVDVRELENLREVRAFRVDDVAFPSLLDDRSRDPVDAFDLHCADLLDEPLEFLERGLARLDDQGPGLPLDVPDLALDLLGLAEFLEPLLELGPRDASRLHAVVIRKREDPHVHEVRLDRRDVLEGCHLDLRHDEPRKPSADLLESVRDFLLARVERERFHRDRQGRLRFRLRRFRGRLLRADRRPRLLAAWGGFHLNGGRPELLEDFLGLFLCDEFCEPLHLGRGQLFEREPRVGQDLGGLLGNPAVPQRLNRRRSGHRHSSDGGSSSSTSTSSSEISTYMSFSVRPYDAISCSRSRSFQEGSSPRTSCKMSSMSTARPWTLRDGSTPSSPNLNWMIVSAVFRTVPSSLTLRSSRALISRRCMYPERDVRTAVSTSPSRPPIAWKKYSVGWRPLLYDDLTNPFASAPRSPFRK